MTYTNIIKLMDTTKDADVFKSKLTDEDVSKIKEIKNIMREYRVLNNSEYENKALEDWAIQKDRDEKLKQLEI